MLLLLIAMVESDYFCGMQPVVNRYSADQVLQMSSTAGNITLWVTRINGKYAKLLFASLWLYCEFRVMWVISRYSCRMFQWQWSTSEAIRMKMGKSTQIWRQIIFMKLHWNIPMQVYQGYFVEWRMILKVTFGILSGVIAPSTSSIVLQGDMLEVSFPIYYLDHDPNATSSYWQYSHVK